MMLWRVLCIIAIVIFITSVIIIVTKGLLRNNYYHDFKEDELLKETRSVNSKNKIFFTSGHTRKYIKRYALCHSAYDKYLICDFNQKYRYISFYVICYNSRKKIKDVLFITESNTNLTSKIISLSTKTKHINIVVKSIDGVDINTNVIKPLSIRKIQAYSLFNSIAFFSLLFIIRHIIIEVLGQEYKEAFLSHIYNILFILGILLLSLINYVYTSHSLRKKNSKYASGGSLEYEFI